MVVIAGRPTVRSAEGERELGEGELLAFPAGPDGTFGGDGEHSQAHAVRLEDEVAPWAGELDEPPRPLG
jgi:hypothetical protein